MLLKIILELMTAWVVILLGNLFWSPQRRKRAIRMILASDAILGKYVTPDLLIEPPQLVARFAIPANGGYLATLGLFVAADRSAQLKGQLLTGALSLAVLALSGFLGPTFLAVNALLFVLMLRGRPGGLAFQQSIEWLQIMAVILFRWHGASPNECDSFVTQTPDLAVLRAHVLKVTT